MKVFASLSTITAALLMLAVSSLSTAQEQADPAPAAVPAEVSSAIRASFKASRPGLGLQSIMVSEIDGLYAVQVANGPVLYSTADGKYFVLGDLYQAAPGGFINLAEKAREGGRAELMATLKTEDMIIFAPEQQPAKAAIMVFTDVDCFYCQKLHQEVPDLNRLGIEVRYLAYPRAGIGSDSYKKIASAWCAADKQTAMTKLKTRQRIPTNVCPGNPVEAQFKLGQQVGVSGTPALVTTEGRLMPGYMPALQLASALGIAVEPALAAELQKKQAAANKK
ncbi:DsbC family protein [Oceanicoccus sagamiensis]|uniref:Thiol:disulfide interchange protein n=1 Tax=Oceanicoccus sagamiensis TaxID=716816 RepID=A0A1X9NHT0_9GAMM|nr:DsbC family protein [Oceanicoccus sagamiensis]ARN75395.1 protein-disulfide isomerase [Oceanicoccus sagamiensis]